MRLIELARGIGARILTHDAKAPAIEIKRIYAGDNISDMLNSASDSTLLVTNIANKMLNRVAELMDVPAICLVNGVAPAPEILELANGHGTVLVVSPVSLFETCGRLFVCLNHPLKPSA
jgi:serine kinase of HPr protein (carbohydrate metabolism regulator)